MLVTVIAYLSYVGRLEQRKTVSFLFFGGVILWRMLLYPDEKRHYMTPRIEPTTSIFSYMIFGEHQFVVTIAETPHMFFEFKF